MCSFQEKKVTVIGLGISNTPLLAFLLQHGAIITARDRKPFDLLPDEVKRYAGEGVRFVCGDNYLQDIEADVIFKAPGIRFDLPEITKAVENGAVLTSEMELFFSLCPGKIIGVTGSDGKTTTTTLIYTCLSAHYGKEHVFVGGNIGKPLLPELDKMDENTFAVVELSSFQLHTMHHSPDRAIITNLSPNHLDYHHGMAEYVDAKTNIYRYAKPGSVLVLNGENEVTKSLGGDAPAGVEIRRFLTDDVTVSDSAILCHGEEWLKTDEIKIPGRHNIENFAGVIALIHDLVPKSIVQNVARTFPGVPHRIELVREKDGVRYYNSSIDSSPTRTTAALHAFQQKLIVILGGYDKHIPFEPLGAPLCEMAKTVVLTGATAEKIKAAILGCPDYRPGNPVIIEEPDFGKAVLTASAQAKSGDIVILSPACASFDCFPNFEVRGNTFKDIILGLS